MPCLINSQTLKMISKVDHFYAHINKGHQWKAEEYSGQHIVSTYYSKDEASSPKNYNQNNKHQSSSQKFRLQNNNNNNNNNNRLRRTLPH